jgi:hypothetical protein
MPLNDLESVGHVWFMNLNMQPFKSNLIALMVVTQELVLRTLSICLHAACLHIGLCLCVVARFDVPTQLVGKDFSCIGLRR